MNAAYKQPRGQLGSRAHDCSFAAATITIVAAATAVATHLATMAARRLDAASLAAGAAACEHRYYFELPTGQSRKLGPRDDVNASIQFALAKQLRWTEHSWPDGRSGGLAILLRGHAYRGQEYYDNATVVAAQQLASRSVASKIIAPYDRRGVRVRVFLTLYDSITDELTRELYRPYEAHLAAVTRISSRRDEQITTVANALNAFLDHCERHGENFDAVVVTRYDMHFKADFWTLLGGSLVGFAGVHFPWQELELGSKWREYHTPSEYELRRHDAAGQKAMLAAATTAKHHALLAMMPHRWQRSYRTADTLVAFGFAYTRCVRDATYMEMTRNWVSYADPRHEGNASEKPWKPHVVSNHWLHKLRYHLARATNGSFFFLIDNSTFDSNPCQGACGMNPLYDLLPRNSWLVESDTCQRLEDFSWDNVSQTLCCPAPDYCCPNSLHDCSDPRAVLYDAEKAHGGAGIPREVLMTGWLTHYLMRADLMKRGHSRTPPYPLYPAALPRLCPASEWDGGNGPRKCRFTMTNASLALVEGAWRAAPPWGKPWPRNADNVHMWSAGNGSRYVG